MFRLLVVSLLLATPLAAVASEIPPTAESFANAYYRVKTVPSDMNSATVESLFNSMASSRCRYIDKLGEDHRGVRVVFLCQR